MTTSVEFGTDTLPLSNEGRYLYAVVPAQDVDDARLPPGLAAIRVGGRCAITGGVPDALARASDGLPMADLERAVRDHERIVEDILAWASSLVPVRFGTVLTSTAALELLLSSNAGALDRALHAVAGRCEWGITVQWEADQAYDAARQRIDSVSGPGPRGPGHQYLAMRRQERAMAHALSAACGAVAQHIESILGGVAQVRRSSGGWVEAERTDGGEGVAPRAITVLRVCALVSKDDEEPFSATLDAALRRYPGLSASISGPWPPYSFVDIAEMTAR